MGKGVLGRGCGPVAGLEAELVGALVDHVEGTEEDRHKAHAVLDARHVLPTPGGKGGRDE